MLIFYRRLPKFDYERPKNEEELFGLLSTKNARVYAGGTDLIPKLKKRLIEPPELLVDLKGIRELDYIYEEGNFLRIGALATIYSVFSSSLVNARFPSLCQAARSIGAFQIQNRGTIVGNICNAVPSADSAPVLLTLDAIVHSKSREEERRIPIEEFFVGPNRTVLKEKEIVKEIEIPLSSLPYKGIYLKLTTRARLDLAIVGVAVLLLIKDGRFEDIRIGLGAVAEKPIRAKKAESLLKGERINEMAILEASKVASLEARPIDDHRATAAYRTEMVKVLVRRAIKSLTGEKNG